MISKETMEKILNAPKPCNISELPEEFKQLIYPVVSRFVKELKDDPIKFDDDKMYTYQPNYSKAFMFVRHNKMKKDEFFCMFKIEFFESDDPFLKEKIDNNKPINIVKMKKNPRMFVLHFNDKTINDIKPKEIK